MLAKEALEAKLRKKTTSLHATISIARVRLTATNDCYEDADFSKYRTRYAAATAVAAMFV